MNGPKRTIAPFDYYVRSITTACLAMGIVGSTIYEYISKATPPALLVGWSGIILGVYFGYHVAANSKDVRMRTRAGDVPAEPSQIDRRAEVGH